MTLSARQHMTLTENAHLFALLLNPGIDWRTACRIGSAIGQAVAASVSTHLMGGRNGHDATGMDVKRTAARAAGVRPARPIHFPVAPLPKIPPGRFLPLTGGAVPLSNVCAM